ncbi:hypothetical protein AB4144_23935 [Rhizobiaceae sp. 2RAB30]
MSFSDIACWAALTGTLLRREEIAVLRRMDAAFIAEIRKSDKERADAAADHEASRKKVSERPLTGALFDALFCN